MTTMTILAILAILFGIAVIVFPQFLKLIVGGYFILWGALTMIDIYT